MKVVKKHLATLEANGWVFDFGGQQSLLGAWTGAELLATASSVFWLMFSGLVAFSCKALNVIHFCK